NRAGVSFCEKCGGRPDVACPSSSRGRALMPTVEPLFDPNLPEFHANPYPFYHALRQKDPIHQSPMGFWVLTRYDDVVMSLRDPRYGRDGFAPLIEATYGPETAEGNLPRSMLMRDPPDHTRLRALVNKAFTPRVIEGMRAHIQTIVDRLLDKVQDARSMDVIDDLAYPLPDLRDAGGPARRPRCDPRLVVRYRPKPRCHRPPGGPGDRGAGRGGPSESHRLLPSSAPGT